MAHLRESGRINSQFCAETDQTKSVRDYQSSIDCHQISQKMSEIEKCLIKVRKRGIDEGLILGPTDLPTIIQWRKL